MNPTAEADVRAFVRAFVAARESGRRDCGLNDNTGTQQRLLLAGPEMRVRHHASRWLAVSLLGLTAVGHAQTTPPDAGSLLKQIEQGEQQPRLPQPQRPLPTPSTTTGSKGDMVLTVSRFRFVGNRLISDKDLQGVVAPWAGRPVNFQELQKAALAVAATYRESGWLVRAFLPKQEIEDGVVTIQVVEAVFGAVQIDASPALRLNPEAAQDTIRSAQKPGQPFNIDAVDRALLLLEDTPGLRVQGDLKEGKTDGETDLLLQLSPLPLWGGDVSVDNMGSRSTGSNRVSGTLTAASPLRIGDQAGINLLHTEGSDYVRGVWSAPIGRQGLRAEVSHSHLDYHVVNPEELARLDVKGHSQTTGLGLSYPVVRSRLQNLYLHLTHDHKRYFNASNGATISDYRIDVSGATLTGQVFDQLGGGGSSLASIGLVAGKVDLARSPNADADAAGPRTAGRYTKLQYSFSRFQTLTPELSLSAALSGQSASKNMDSSEKFYLGGPNGVRAYPSSEAGGSDGTLLNVEARYRLPRNVTVSAFYDWGQVRVNHDNDFAGAAAKNRLHLQGAGLGLAWVGPMGTNLKLTWAHRIGSNPNPTATGQDQDGTLHKHRIWIWANVTF